MQNHTLEIIVEKTLCPLIAAKTDPPDYGVARVVGSNGGYVKSGGASHVLTTVTAPRSSVITVPEGECVPIPPSLGEDEALLAVPLAAALSVWERLQLELGEIAVYTEGNILADLVGQVAVWRGGCPVVRLDSDPEWAPLNMGERLSIADPEEALRHLQKRVHDKPGFTAVDLSGRPEIIDLLLEAMPRWGRLMLAGRTPKPLTVDFYNNVHRKGALLLCEVFEPVSVFEKREREAYLSTAFRLMEKTEIAEVCSRLVPAHQSS